jgi:hypothetical protein
MTNQSSIYDMLMLRYVSAISLTGVELGNFFYTLIKSFNWHAIIMNGTGIKQL